MKETEGVGFLLAGVRFKSAREWNFSLSTKFRGHAFSDPPPTLTDPSAPPRHPSLFGHQLGRLILCISQEES